MAEKLYQSKIATLPLFLQYRKGDRKCIDFFSIIYYKVVNLSINQENENVRLITGNIEALAEEEGGLDCNYNRHPSQCEIYVGAKGKVKLLGGSIISAGVDGYVRFDGQVACSRGGDFACTPIECKELYEIIF